MKFKKLTFGESRNASLLLDGEIEETEVRGLVKIKNAFQYVEYLDKNIDIKSDLMLFVCFDKLGDPKDFPDWPTITVKTLKFKLPSLKNLKPWEFIENKVFKASFIKKEEAKDIIIPVSKIIRIT